MQFNMYLTQLIRERYYPIIAPQSLCKVNPERAEEDCMAVFNEMSVLTLWKLVIKDKCPPDHSRPPSNFESTAVSLSLLHPFFQTQISKSFCNVCKTIKISGHMEDRRCTQARRGYCCLPTWLALSSGARSACRAFCTSPGRARRAAGMRSPPSGPARSPGARGTWSGGTPGLRWKCVQPSCHWAWCTCKGKPKGTSLCSTVHVSNYYGWIY